MSSKSLPNKTKEGSSAGKALSARLKNLDQVKKALDEADRANLKETGFTLTQEELQGEEDFFKAYGGQSKAVRFKEGDVVKGKVLSVHDDYVLVDINYKSEGIISRSEFRVMPGKDKELIKEGSELDVYIVKIENDNGMVVLSKDRADIMRIWKDISNVVENEEVIEGTVMAKVKGGLSVDIGVKAFLPGSQIELRSVPDLDDYIGKKMKFKVIKFNQKRGNIVLSRRALLTQERKDMLGQTLEEIKEGAIIKGVVKNITDYGAFLDLGGLDGLLHITDMSWSRIKHPSEVISMGEEREVKVLKFNAEKNRVSLGLKQLTEAPWIKASQEIKEGDVVKVQVMSLVDYGAFMKIREGVEGLVHISEMSWGKKLRHPSQLLTVGDEVDVKVLNVDQKNQRISLGIRQLKDNPWTSLVEKYPLKKEVEGVVKSVTDFGLFVELEGEEVDAFIHISDFSWAGHVQPKKLYSKGQKIKACVKEVNPQEERFTLSVKMMTEDPWKKVSEKYPLGSQHTVKVRKVMDFGLFVVLEPGVEGLIHISELSTKRVEKVTDVAKEEDVLEAEILTVDVESRKMGLSIKQIELREGREDETGQDGTGKAEGKDTKDGKKSAKKGDDMVEGKETEKDKREDSAFGKAFKKSLLSLDKEKEKPKKDEEQKQVVEKAKEDKAEKKESKEVKEDKVKEKESKEAKESKEKKKEPKKAAEKKGAAKGEKSDAESKADADDKKSKKKKPLKEPSKKTAKEKDEGTKST